MLRTAAVLSVLALGASAKEPEYVDAPEDQYQKSELDAMSQVAGSEKMKGMKFGKREVAKDGMSGRIFLEPEGGPSPPETWNPQFVVSPRALRSSAGSEDLVLRASAVRTSRDSAVARWILGTAQRQTRSRRVRRDRVPRTIHWPSRRPTLRSAGRPVRPVRREASGVSSIRACGPPGRSRPSTSTASPRPGGRGRRQDDTGVSVYCDTDRTQSGDTDTQNTARR